VHQCSHVEEKSSNFAKKIHSYLWNNVPKAMECLENKKKSLNIDDGEGHLVDQSPFTSFSLTINYEVKFMQILMMLIYVSYCGYMKVYTFI
jgi:hypothetical protein